MNLSLDNRNRRVGRRAAALIAAIAVLAILTLLVMGLATVEQGAMITNAKIQSEQQAREIALLGFEAAWAAISKIPGGLTQPLPTSEHKAESGSFSISASPANPENAIYGGGFIKYRPGDVLLSISASTPRLQSEVSYLINTSPERPRRICLKDSLRGAATPKPAEKGAPAGGEPDVTGKAKTQ